MAKIPELNVKLAMAELYPQVRDGLTDLKTATELANIAGKYLKADALEFAKTVWVAGRSKEIGAPLPGSSVFNQIAND